MFKNFLCKIGFHKFTKWKTIKEGTETYWNGSSRPVIVQERTCEICRITKRRMEISF